MELGLENKVALVTAASKGIGLGTAKVLAQEGCRMVICSRSKEELEKAKSSIVEATKNEEKILAIPADLSSEDDIEHLVSETQRRFGAIDILAYNTGSPKVAGFLQLSNEDWDHGVKLLLLSAVWLAKRVIPPMKEKKWGRLIFISSMTLKQPIPNLVLSNVVRLSIAGLSKDLSEEFGGYGITSNIIMQGNILTGRQKAVTEDYAKRNNMPFEEAQRARVKEVPAGRFGTAEEIGNAVAFLASDQASYINGASLLVDGGLVRSVL
jgi:3-oxoacyl-[acyl-carrier protein] reductase